MNQKPIVLYLRMKGMALDAIHNDLVRRLGKDAASYSTVIKYVRSAQLSGRKEATHPEAPDVERSPIDEAIFTALAEFPFSSVRELSRRICLPRSTMHQHLTQSLRFTVRHLRWVPRFLTRNRSRFGSRWQLNYYRSSLCKAPASGTILSPWTSRGFICSVSMI
jgi:hypothetical protein